MTKRNPKPANRAPKAPPPAPSLTELGGGKTAHKRRVNVPGAGDGGTIPPIEHRFKPGNKAAVGYGRPRKLEAFQELIKDILGEEQTTVLDNGQRITLTRAQVLVRMMLTKSPSDRIALLEYAFGKVKQEMDVTSNGETLKGYTIVSPDDWQDADENHSDIPPAPLADTSVEG